MNVKGRVIFAACAVTVVTGLFLWQHYRNGLMAQCARAGGAWNGRVSQCIPLPGAPLLQRDLRRS